MRVVITDHDFSDMRQERAVFEAAGIELGVSNVYDEAGVVAAGRDADGLLIQTAAITDRVLEQLPRCRVIARYGVGYDTIDVDAATRHHVVVANVPAYCTTEVADHAMALMLALTRRVVTLNDEIRRGTWDVYHSSGHMRRLGSLTLGIVGLGRIGQAVANRGQAFGMQVQASDPNRPGTLPLDQVLSTSDIVSIHCPLNAETRHLIGARELSLMQPSAVLVNTARGPIVNEDALVEALREGRLAGAGLDVVESEPLPIESPLRETPNLILTPHAAFYSLQSYDDLHRMAAEAVLDVLQGRVADSMVNPAALRR